MPGYEAGKWAPYSAGRALLQSLVEWCIERKIERFDLTVGDEEYKRFWANVRMRLYESRYPRTIRGACFLAAQRFRTAIDARPRGAGPAARTSGEAERPCGPLSR
jgi:CelD/BcsL family acetyltransferase involved in cellulose biosynthesis